MKRTWILIIMVTLTLSVSAKVTLPRVIGSQMVLQQQSEVRLWGWSDQKSVTVNASWQGKQTHKVQVVDG